MSLGLREAHRAGKVRSSCCRFLLTARVKSYVFGKPSSPVQRQTEVWDRAGLEQHKIWVVALELLALPLHYPGLAAAICFAGAWPCPASSWFWFHSRWSWLGREQFAQLDFLLKKPQTSKQKPPPYTTLQDSVVSHLQKRPVFFQRDLVKKKYLILHSFSCSCMAQKLYFKYTEYATCCAIHL